MRFNLIKALKRTFSPQVYFTIETGQQGFTDQMMQLSSFYKLGKACGFEYHHRPFISTRSEPLDKKKVSEFEDIYDFLGLRDYFSKRQHFFSREPVTYEVNLSDAILENARVKDFNSLVEYVKSKVSQAENTKNTERPNLFILRLDRAKPAPGKGKRQFFSLINGASEANKFSLEFSAIYSQARLKKNFASTFSSKGFKALIHIRQGDTAVVSTPWNTFVPVDKRRPDYLTQNDSLEEITSRYFDKFVDSIFTPKDYYDFWEALLAHLPASVVELKVFSDGYQRAIDSILSGGKILKLSNEQRSQLETFKDNVDNVMFSSFSGLNDTEYLVGETAESLYKLVDSALHADLIITAAQQRMLPKLISNFMPRSGPSVIVLYRNNPPDYSDMIASHDSRFIYVDINNPDYDDIVRRLANKLFLQK